nr:heterokaryon incompatibility protein 6, or allele [Quercus suber]
MVCAFTTSAVALDKVSSDLDIAQCYIYTYRVSYGSMTQYHYSPLAPDEIRLLELQAGSIEKELSAVIHIVRLPEDDEPSISHEVQVTREGGVEVPKAPLYSALSYTWGVSKHSHHITILNDGQIRRLPIKKNLHDALSRLRQEIVPNGSRMLWADAICINQDDNQEKSRQIQKMAQIYNRAESVSVYLGPGDDDTRRAIEFVDRLLKLEDFDPLTQDPGTPADWACLHDLMQKPWFSRRWIVQEIALARSATLFCGEQSVSWQDFSAATSLFVARYRDLRHLFQNSKEFHNHPNYLGEVDALGAKLLVEITTNLFRKNDEGVVLERLLSLEALISTLTLFEAGSAHDTVYAVLWLSHDAEPDARYSAALSFDPLVRTPTQSPEIDMEPSQFDETQRTQNYFSGPRTMSPSTQQDTNFEMKSPILPVRKNTFLKPPLRKPARSASDVSKMLAETHFHIRPHAIEVDYDSDIYDVYKQFLEFVMGRSRFLDVLCNPWAPEPQRGQPALPTWIPQLSSAPFEKRPGQNSYRRVRADSLVGTPGLGPRNYNASGKTKMYPPKGFIQGRTLVVTGFVLDAVHVRKNKDIAIEGVIPFGWLDLVDYHGSPDPVPDRFWRTLVADRGPGGSKYAPAYFPIACKWVCEQRSRRGNINTTELLTYGKCPSIATEFLRRVQSVIWDRTLVLTEGRKGSKKLLALVPAEVEEGDLICILYGCSVPVVLRRHRKRKADEDVNRSHATARTESSLSSTTSGAERPGLQDPRRPQISLSRASSNAAMSEYGESAPESFSGDAAAAAPELGAPSQGIDTTYSSYGVRRALHNMDHHDTPPDSEHMIPGLAISLESPYRYQFIGECYVHGMMAGEGFKHQQDHGNKLRAFHLI